MSKLEYFKKKVLSILDSQEKAGTQDFKKSFAYIVDVVAKGNFPVGTIREWKGKKYIKVAPGKWRPKYDSNSRGAKLSIAALKRKAENCKTSQELLQLVLENRDRFSDKDGKPLPFVKELSDYVSGLNDKIESEKKEGSYFTDSEFKKRLKDGKEIIADFFKEQWNNERYIKAGRDRLMDVWAVGEAKRYAAVNTQTDMFKKLSASEKKKAREFNEKLKHEFEAEAAKIFEEYKKGGTTKTTRSNSNYTEETLSETPTTSVPQSGKKSSAIMQIRAKYESAPIVTGNKKTVTLPNGAKIKCHYKLVEADAPTASHDEHTYSPTKGFPTSKDGKTVNDRDYQNDKDAQESVRKIAANFNSLALESPPIVTKDGIVVSGNNRTMSSKLAAKNGTDAAYVADLKEMIDEYGLEESDLEGFKHPRLILEIDAEHEGDYTTEEFAQFNRDTKKTMSNVEKAVKITKTLTEEKIQSLASELSSYETMGELYADAKGCQRFVAKLIDAGIIGDNEKAQYLKSDGTLNDTGKYFAETVLVGTVLNENNIRRLDGVGGKRIRQKMVRAILPLVENKGTGKEYSFNKELNDAVDIAVSVARNHEKYPNVETYLAQGTLFGESKPDEVTGKLAKLIHDEGEKAFATRMKNLGAGLKRSADGEMDIFLGQVETKQSLMERFLSIQKSITDILTNLYTKERSIRSIVAETLQKCCG
ncbi:hypothetical protein E4N71_11190 [Treponema vincentii]|uniref:hypothetical protein n=1 Tax=Treponema vincentii TaxID=69710 RepID=UPI003D8D52DB